MLVKMPVLSERVPCLSVCLSPGCFCFAFGGREKKRVMRWLLFTYSLFSLFSLIASNLIMNLWDLEIFLFYFFYFGLTFGWTHTVTKRKHVTKTPRLFIVRFNRYFLFPKLVSTL
jgi:hypothetical protein